MRAQNRAILEYVCSLELFGGSGAQGAKGSRQGMEDWRGRGEALKLSWVRSDRTVRPLERTQSHALWETLCLWVRFVGALCVRSVRALCVRSVGYACDRFRSLAYKLLLESKRIKLPSFLLLSCRSVRCCSPSASVAHLIPMRQLGRLLPKALGSYPPPCPRPPRLPCPPRMLPVTFCSSSPLRLKSSPSQTLREMLGTSS